MRKIGIAATLLFLTACSGGEDAPAANPTAAAAPPTAPASAAAPLKANRYAAFDKLLKTYVDTDGMVDYAGWKKTDEAALQGVVKALASVDASALKGNEKKAYWINVYNAVTLQAMLEFHPVTSILKVTKDGKAYDVFKKYPFGPKRLTLNHIEHQILRKVGDPRIHAAIVCASKGCPPLLNRAYLPKTLDAQLDANVKTWFKSPTRGLKLSGDTAHVSEIFNWFGVDFGKTKQAHLNWIAHYVDAKTAKRLKSGDLSVKYIKWDWSANKQ